VFHLLSFDLLCLLHSIVILWDYLKFNCFPIFASLLLLFVWVTHKKEKRRRRSCWISQKSRSLALRVRS
jgi:hypothetical protein